MIGVVSKVYNDEAMPDSGLAVRLDALLALWPELKKLTEEFLGGCFEKVLGRCKIVVYIVGSGSLLRAANPKSQSHPIREPLSLCHLTQAH